jgi:hypothetical protein
MLKKFTTITIAAAAGLGALAMSAPSASAKSFHISIGGGHWGHGHWGHHHWGHRHWGYRSYYAPVVYGGECYYVRRYGRLFKVCE